MAQQTFSVKEVLESIGYRLKRVGTNYMTKAIYRGGNNPTALSIHSKTGGWHDFVSGESGTLKQLVKKTIGKDFDGTIEYSKIEDTFESLPEEAQLKTFDPKLLENLLPAYSYWNKRGISDDTLRLFKNGVGHRNEMYQRSVFPIYNPDGKIYGFAGRSILEDRVPKWKLIGKKSEFIYPVYFNGDYITKSDHIILVESIGCVLGLWEAGIRNTLCLFGTSILPKRMCYLLSLNKKVIIATNNDLDKEKNRGLIAAEKIKESLSQYFDDSKVMIFLPFSGDFNDQTKTENMKWHDDLILTMQKKTIK